MPQLLEFLLNIHFPKLLSERWNWTKQVPKYEDKLNDKFGGQIFKIQSNYKQLNYRAKAGSTGNDDNIVPISVSFNLPFLSGFFTASNKRRCFSAAINPSFFGFEIKANELTRRKPMRKSSSSTWKGQNSANHISKS